MAFKTFQLDDLGTVTIYKRRGSRSLRLSILPNGNVRVTIPQWAPYTSGLSFVRSRSQWIKQQQLPRSAILQDGQVIGIAHRLRFVTDPAVNRVTSRVYNTDIIIRMPASITFDQPAVQATANAAAVRALRKQAEDILPGRLQSLANAHGYSYHSVSIKQLKSRWGSCDSQQNIALNLYLMLLPNELIEYVLLHELAHTRVMQHGPTFWSTMSTLLPDTQQRRKAIKNYRPSL